MYREIKLYNVCVSDIIASLNKVNVPTILLFLEYQYDTLVSLVELNQASISLVVSYNGEELKKKIIFGY